MRTTSSGASAPLLGVETVCNGRPNCSVIRVRSIDRYTLNCETVLNNREISAMRIGEGAVRAFRHGRREDPAQKRAFKSALELRFQVYCLECNFLSPDDYPDGMESDEHDDAATHFYAFDAREELVGYVRLVRADREQLFPIQRNCSLSVDGTSLPAPSAVAEISRLMVRNDYRRRRGDRLSGVTAEQNQAAFGGDRRHEAPQVLLSLYRQMYAYSRENGIRHWYAAMERPLARSLQRLNFAFQLIGPETDYYGPVAPYVADLRELEAQVGARRPELLQWLQAPERWFGPTTHGDEWGLCHISRPAVLPRADAGVCA